MDMRINCPLSINKVVFSIENLLTLYVNVYKGGKTMGGSKVSKGTLEILNIGSKGKNVYELQLRLNKETLFDEKGQKLPKLVSDGDYGGHTEDAVKAYQRAHNLKLNGIAGPNTLESLGFTYHEHILTPKADGKGPKQVHLSKRFNSNNIKRMVFINSNDNAQTIVKTSKKA